MKKIITLKIFLASVVVLLAILQSSISYAGCDENARCLTADEALDLVNWYGCPFSCGCSPVKQIGNCYSVSSYYGYLDKNNQLVCTTSELPYVWACFYTYCSDPTDLYCLTGNPCSKSGDPCCGVNGCCQ